MADYVTCGRCHADLRGLPNDQPCPNCGETSARIIGPRMVETMTTMDSLAFKHKVPGERKPVAEGFNGWEDSRDGSGRVVRKVRLIDRQRDWYEEVVVDARTGELLRECRERLGEHFERGSARPRDNS